MKQTYAEFLERKRHVGAQDGFTPTFLPDFLFPFQRALVTWAVEKGRAALFEDTGLGKTAQQLVWAQNVVEHTNKPVLILTPLAVGPQTVREAEKFGVEAKQSRDGSIPAKITVTNYQQLHKYDWKDFGGIVCDESGILKHHDGAFRNEITAFMRGLRYRLLCTATPAPNDHMELGTSSEALGYLRRVEMLVQYFNHDGGETSKWRLKKHASKSIFWHWVCSWARAVRRPSDMGFDNAGYSLKPLVTAEHIVKSPRRESELLFDAMATGLEEQRAERRATIQPRCEKAAELLSGDAQGIAWCHLNEEGHLLEKLIPGAVEVEGSDSDEYKEEVVEAFVAGQVRVIATKPRLFGWGLNLQNCARMSFFPSHSFEEYYQAVRRCWRFGQKQSVRVEVISSEGEAGVLANLNRKALQADAMFANLAQHINGELISTTTKHNHQTTALPTWL